MQFDVNSVREFNIALVERLKKQIICEYNQMKSFKLQLNCRVEKLQSFKFRISIELQFYMENKIIIH